MENNRDEHIVCADCSASFLFSAGEAAVFQERGLAAPKRCKDCRRARKDRQGGQGDGPRGPRGPRPAQAEGRWSPSGDAGPPRDQRFDGGAPRGFRGAPAGGGGGFRGAPAGGGGFRGGPRQGPPRYTGDVNEYRSPMQDTRWAQPQWQGNAPPPQRAPRRGGPGIYRDPGDHRGPSGPIDGASGFAARGPKVVHEGGPPRRKPQGEVFSITCNACGAVSEVPFKPAEGREVFCQPCYRARKPAV